MFGSGTYRPEYSAVSVQTSTSPRPFMALTFAPDAKKFVGCPIAIADIRTPGEGDHSPEKVKAAKCAGPVFEVDIDGERITA